MIIISEQTRHLNKVQKSDLGQADLKLGTKEWFGISWSG
jgi:hypothetical protein